MKFNARQPSPPETTSNTWTRRTRMMPVLTPKKTIKLKRSSIFLVVKEAESAPTTTWSTNSNRVRTTWGVTALLLERMNNFKSRTSPSSAKTMTRAVRAKMTSVRSCLMVLKACCKIRLRMATKIFRDWSKRSPRKRKNGRGSRTKN